ncbi:RteC domain-containing protein [Myroides injenensis]|uniref:RteC domain-containing protein n=1 Tax=Myroides injenensis TaxID=1183151 RepID=UPI000289F82B|nr:RteC domain-containing protein [Myroides injenensis]
MEHQNMIFKKALNSIEIKEAELSLLAPISIENTLEIIHFIQLTLVNLKTTILKNGFDNQTEEIAFFKTIKPQILSKLIFYNKVYKIELSCPMDYNSQHKYYLKQIEELSLEYKKHFSQCDFYKYYKSNRSDKDLEYFTLGKITPLIGMNSFAFEIDTLFSTFYDYKVSRILAHNLLQHYLQQKISEHLLKVNNTSKFSETLVWSESQNALIELIYALYVSGSINNGKLEIRKIAVLFQQLFGITLLDIHHAFHRMKTRAKSRTCYLDKLKQGLEEYMDKEI